METSAYDIFFSINYFPLISDICEAHSLPYIYWTCDSQITCMHHNSIFNSCNIGFLFDYTDFETFKNIGANVHYLPLAGAVDRIEYMLASSDDLENFKRLRKNTYRNEDIVIYNQGCWKENTVLKFDNIGSTSSAVSDAEDAIEIQVCSLDRISDCLDASFIKMDIEGAELEALKGAEQIIRNFKPKLAICAYHKPEDLYTLPELIKSFRDDYVFYLRHYTDTLYETVLYAF